MFAAQFLSFRNKSIALKSVIVALVFMVLIKNLDRDVVSKKYSLRSDSSRRSDEIKYPFVTNFERKDWHDWKFIEYEKTRKGPGEQGVPFELTDPEDIKLNEKLFKSEGLFALVSDKISVNRSIPDNRHPECKKIQYLKTLPKVSIIIIFHNEWFSMLLRTVHSVVNRSPRELVNEIILVNDASTKKELYEPLEKYMKDNFGSLVRIINLQERKGLIVARLVGSKSAKSEVLVFLDAHMEANVNWLPPLLEPVALEPRTVATPVVKLFDYETFDYSRVLPNTRAVFDWYFQFKWLPRLPIDNVFPWKPAKLPVMLGCTFAIRKDYFFDIGAYDEGLLIWNGEHYELSLKLWLCGGKLLEIPCSHVGHTFRAHCPQHKSNLGFDYVAYNFKRVAEVWLDEYKYLLYGKDPDVYNNMDPGNLAKVKAAKERLNCRPFKYFIDQVVPDMLERYPIHPRGDFARGAIQSEADMSLCVDNGDGWTESRLELNACDETLDDPKANQHFILSWQRDVRRKSPLDHCLEESDVSFSDCTFEFGSQFWFYNTTTHQIVNPAKITCLTAVTEDKALKMEECDESDKNQRWLWGYTNVTALSNWNTFGVKLPK